MTSKELIEKVKAVPPDMLAIELMQAFAEIRVWRERMHIYLSMHAPTVKTYVWAAYESEIKDARAKIAQHHDEEQNTCTITKY
jgi:hypothetical protein